MAVKTFICYAHKDAELLSELLTHLVPLQQQSLIEIWTDRKITAGQLWELEIDNHLDEAGLILILVTAQFLASEKCRQEMEKAIKRFYKSQNSNSNALVIPVILDFAIWKPYLEKFQALPASGKPVAAWPNRAEAFNDVANGIKEAIENQKPKVKVADQSKAGPGFAEGPLLKAEVALSLVKTAEVNEEIGALTDKVDLDPEESIPTFILETRASATVDLDSEAKIPTQPLESRVNYQADPNRSAMGILDISPGINIPERGVVRLRRHSKAITSLAFSPRGKSILASGSADKSIILWDLDTHRDTFVLEGHLNPITSLAFSSDGKTLISGSSDSMVKLWDLDTKQCLHELEQGLSSVLCVAVHSDTKIIASGHARIDTGEGVGIIQLWDIQSGERLVALEGHLDSVISCAINPDGTTLISGSTDKTIKLWDLGSKSCIHTLKLDSGDMTSMAISADGKFVVVSDNRTIDLWRLETGQRLCTFKADTAKVRFLAISADGKMIASGSNHGTISLWDIRATAPGRTLRQGDTRNMLIRLLNVLGVLGKNIQCVAFSPDGQTIVGGGEDGSIDIWSKVIPG